MAKCKVLTGSAVKGLILLNGNRTLCLLDRLPTGFRAVYARDVNFFQPTNISTVSVYTVIHCALSADVVANA